MKITELIAELARAESVHGDVECLVEVVIDDCVAMMPVEELNFENRYGYGESISLIC